MNSSRNIDVQDSFIKNMRRIRIALLLILFALPLHSTDHAVKWTTLTSADGLSQNSVYAILQDSDGFMWFGTRFGLNRYDGKSIRFFPHDVRDTYSVPSHRINSLIEDRKGDLWVGTVESGIAKFDKILEHFIRYSHDPSDSTSLSTNNTSSLFLDSRGTLWVAHESGFDRYDHNSDSFSRVRIPPQVLSLTATEHITRIVEAPNGVLWLGFDNGAVVRYTIETNNFQVLEPGSTNDSIRISCMLADPGRGVVWIGVFGASLYSFDIRSGRDRDSLSTAQSRTEGMIAGIQTICFGQDGDLWIGTPQSVTRYNPEAVTFQMFRAKRNDPTALQDDDTKELYCDPQGNIWVGTEAGGVSKYSPGLIRFEHIGASPGDSTALLADGIFGIAEDGSGSIWFATVGGGASILDPESGIYRSYTSDDTKETWSRNYISRVLPVDHNTVWLGTFYCGFFDLDPTTGKYVLYRNIDSDPSSFADHTTYGLLEDSQGRIWIGTQSEGLDLFNAETSSFTHFRHDPDNPKSLGSNSTYTLLEDRAGYIWIGTSDNGLSQLDTSEMTFTVINASGITTPRLTSNNVLSLHEDEAENLWIGTRGGGLNRLNSKRDQMTSLDLGAGTLSQSIYSILEDDDGYLWLSTDDGIVKAHPENGLLRLYTNSDGVLEGFYHESSLKASDGTMYFGGMEGYNRFHPDSIKDNENIPPVVLTGLSVNYMPIGLGDTLSGRVLLSESITFTDQFTFEPNDRIIRFTFASLDYSDSKKNQYSYILEGHDREWVASGTNNTAQYMNLPPGTYTFKVRGTNNDGVWNEEGLSVGIIVLPPFWKTLWFRTLMSLFLLALIFVYIRLRTEKMRAQQVKLERLVRERTEQWRKELEDRQRLEIEQTRMKADHLKRELLTQSLHLNDKQQIMEELHDELEVVCEQKPDEAKSRLKKLQRFLKEKISIKEGWEEFEHWFSQVHTGFYSTLKEKYPDLSESELKVCALLRLKMSSKDIARVMNLQPPSVDIYRHRIRKKMALPGNENLSTFLGQF